MFSDQGKFYLEINADGPWTALVEPITSDQDAADGVEGTGDYVSGLFQPIQQGAVPFTFTHTGESNFAVYIRCAGGDDLVQNGIGVVENQAVVRFNERPCLWEVKADGNWSVKPK